MLLLCGFLGFDPLESCVASSGAHTYRLLFVKDRCHFFDPQTSLFASFVFQQQRSEIMNHLFSAVNSLWA
jgi:hypothetical protein